MEQSNEQFEKNAMQYIDWDKKKPIEEIPAEPEQDVIVEEPIQRTPDKAIPNTEEIEERKRREKIEKEIEEEKKAFEKQKEVLLQVRDEKIKEINESLKPLGMSVDDFKDIDPEKVYTPESDKMAIALIEHSFPGVIKEALEELKIKELMKDHPEIGPLLKEKLGIIV